MGVVEHLPSGAELHNTTGFQQIGAITHIERGQRVLLDHQHGQAFAPDVLDDLEDVGRADVAVGRPTWFCSMADGAAYPPLGTFCAQET